MASRRALVRSHQWWNHKVPPVIGVAAVWIGLQPGRAEAGDLAELGLLLLSIAGVASFGHVLNDWTDIEADRRGGKANALEPLSAAQRSVILAGTLVVGLLPWLWLPSRPAARLALLVEIALLVAYSVSPLRLKARGWLGALTDASYAYAVPFLIVAFQFGGPSSEPRPAGPLVALAFWGLLMGLRGILWHQIDDVEADRKAGVETVASRIGPSRVEALVASWLLPVELFAASMLIVAGPDWLRWLALVFVVWRSFQMLLLWVPPLELRALTRREDRVSVLGFELVNEFAERWLAVVALVALAVESPWWWVAVGLFLVAFRNAVSLLAKDLWAIPDAAARLTFAFQVRRDIRDVAARRLERGARGPEPVDDPSARRFVFVVCGPVSHLLTLRTAVRNLRPLTRAEIWVVTDPRRNEHVIDIEGVDHVVEVETPAALNDHQASIWLKTSVHRHVPEGEWCYLDSDVIAVAPGVERVFDQRKGPVAFASDITIVANCVDRFSPWAMTCDCLGFGHQHSCSHLREQLEARFGLVVPGDWVHWNGGVFVFGMDSHHFFDMWHERAVASFDWPEWATRDQGTLISTVWTLSLQELPRISSEFNFIADLGNGDLCLDRRLGWAHHPEGPWFDAKFLHLYTSKLEDPAWDLGTDVEAVVLRRSRVRVYRWRRHEALARARHEVSNARASARNGVSSWRWRVNGWRWRVQAPVELLVLKIRRFPRRLAPIRIYRGLRVRLGLDVSHLPVPDPKEPGPQRVLDRAGR